MNGWWGEEVKGVLVIFKIGLLGKPILRRGHLNQDLKKVREHGKNLIDVKCSRQRGTARALFLRQDLAF